jgi:mono/diheme cytochrome c family protein
MGKEREVDLQLEWGVTLLYRRLLPLFVLFVGAMQVVGCRRAAPPSFSPHADVLNLTKDLEEEGADEEEIEEYKGLQAEIAETLHGLAGTPDKPILLGTKETTPQLEHGFALYTKYCVQCHGVNGDGNGAVAQYMNPRPRNYTRGIFKFTSTPIGSKPRRADLITTLKRGITGTSMPAFDRFSKEELEAVVEYVLVLTLRGELERELAAFVSEEEELPGDEILKEIIADILEPWETASSQIVMPVSDMPPMTEESVKLGRAIFMERACNKCHGPYGRGGSMGNVEVGTDDWGYKGAAADLSSGMLRGGDRFIDVYRRIYSGINGSPMPAFKNVFKDDPKQIWYLVHFIKETSNRRRVGKPPLSSVDFPDEGASAGGAATSEPAAEEPATKEPAAEEPATEEPATEEPAAEEPATEEPAAEEPAAEGPSVEEPKAEEPAAEEPAVEEPAAEEPAAEEPATEEPAAEEPAAEEPAAEEPATEETEAEEPEVGESEPAEDSGTPDAE